MSKAKAYQKKKYILSLIHLVLEAAILFWMVGSGLNFYLKNLATSVSSQFYLQAAIYYGLFFLIFWAFDFFFSLYSEFYLEHQYELSNQNLKQWFLELLKKSALSFGIGLPLILGLYALIRRSPEHWWIWAWLGFAGLSYILGQLFPVLIIPLFYKYQKVDDHLLKERIFNLVERYHLPVENVYSLNLSKTTKKANAMFAGLGRTKRLVLSDTLIQNFTVDEVESVVSHELGHFKHRDIWRFLIFSCIISFVGFAVVFHWLRYFTGQNGYSGIDDLAAFPLLYLIFYIFSVVLTPLNNAFSRWREREADRFALKATGSPYFVSAMEKLARLNLADPDPHPLIEWWFYSHPAIEKRIQMARSFMVSILIVLCLGLSPAYAAVSEKDTDAKVAQELESRNRTEILSYFYGNSKKVPDLKAPLALDLYNQGVEFFQKREYDLAREALEDSLKYDSKNPFAYDLLGDIAYFDQNLDEALKEYEASLHIRPRQSVKEKIEKIQKEKKYESGLSTYQEEHFIIKYGGEEKGVEGFALREYLRNAYREVGQDFGYFFKHKVVVLLYEAEKYRELTGVPHWSSGLYDGKIRLPAYQKGFTQKEIQKIMRHELTHAFIAELSAGKCPAWLNEGLAVYEEGKIDPPDMRIFKAAVKTNTLFPLVSLFDRKQISEMKDPLEVALFYVESYHLVNYLIERYGMFQIKKMLQSFSEGSDSLEVVERALKISPFELENQWKATF